MSTEIQPANSENQTPQQIKQFEEGLLAFLAQHNLPSDKIFVPVLERLRVFTNIEGILDLIPEKEKSNSVYLSKFTAGVIWGK